MTKVIIPWLPVMGAVGFHVILHSTPFEPVTIALDYAVLELTLSLNKDETFPLSRAICRNAIKPIPC